MMRFQVLRSAKRTLLWPLVAYEEIAETASAGFLRPRLVIGHRDGGCSRRRMASSSSSNNSSDPIGVADVPAKTTSVYPAKFQHVVKGRSKRALGNPYGLTNFGVNFTTLEPGAASSLQHYHSKQDEFIIILEGTAVVRNGDEEIAMKAGSCVGFPGGKRVGHCVINRSDAPVIFLEIGDRTPGDVVEYPGVDLRAVESLGQWKFYHKDGRPYHDDAEKEEKAGGAVQNPK